MKNYFNHFFFNIMLKNLRYSTDVGVDRSVTGLPDGDVDDS